MKKFLLFLTLFLSAVGIASAEVKSYTIEFTSAKTDGTNAIDAKDLKDKTYISAGIDYISSFTDASKIYQGTNGLKLGASKSTGSFTIAFAETAQKIPTKIVVNAAQWVGTTGSADATNLQITVTTSEGNTSPDAIVLDGTTLTDYSWEFTGSSALKEVITSLTIATTAKRAYIKSITVTYDDAGSSGGGETDPGPISETNTIKFSGMWSNGTAVKNVDIGSCPAVFANVSGTNPPKYYDNSEGNAVRMYSVNSLTISAPTGYYLSKIDFSGVKGLTNLGLNDNKVGNFSKASDGKSASWTCGSNCPTSVVFKSSGTLWISSITVYIKPSLADDDAGLAFASKTDNTTYGTDYTLQELTNPKSVAVTWSSSNTEVADFNGDGTINIKKAGVTTITATATDAKYTVNNSASYKLTIAKGDPADFAYAKPTYDYIMGDNFSAPTLKIPEGLTVVSYVSNNPGVATVTNEGVITPISRGEAIITAHTNGNDCWNAKDAKLTINITKNIPAVSFTNTEVSLFVEGTADYAGQTLKVTPNDLTVTYALNEEATIGSIEAATGKLTLNGSVGTATVTATTTETAVYESKSTSYTIEVKKHTTELSFAQAAVEVNQGESYAGQTVTCSEIKEALKADFTITYASDNEAVATVDANTGAVTLTGAEGSATITAAASGNTYYTPATASYTITVAKQYIFADTKVTLVKDLSALQPGNIIVIANQTASVAMSTSTDSDTRRGQTSVTLNSDKSEITSLPSDALLLELGQVEVTEKETTTSYWTLNAINFSEEGVLYCGTSSNYLYLGVPQSKNVAKSYAKIAINRTTGEATILLNKGTGTSDSNKNLIMYNDNSDNGQVFSCYNKTQKPVYIYKVETPTTIDTADEIAQSFVATPAGKNNEVKLTYQILTESTVEKFAIVINGVTTDVVSNVENIIDIALSGVPYLPDANITICPVLAEDAEGKPTTLGHPEKLEFTWADINSYALVDLGPSLVWINSDADPLPATATLGANCNFGIDIPAAVTNLNYYVDVVAKNESTDEAYTGEFSWTELGFCYSINPYITGVPVDTENKSLNLGDYTGGFPKITCYVTPIYKFDVAEQYRSLLTPSSARPARVASAIADGVQTVTCDVKDAQVTLTNETEVSGVEGVTVDGGAAVEYFNLQGVRVDGDLAPGIYIRRQGQSVSKVRIR